ncbi:MAG: nucleotide exchange factor GrpE [Nanoarchaeota archaeon]|nr:nucleotide exchange factor GrpE [Nanoarchaeota archaeon]MBU4242052.1 nucleotide exchange factor GrpE [Nanoarchaeota archaeon]MBU4352046.1 nucleotide exchange factor GrpE [Nanoarchaeota archaeon]MBU4455901.1 nucleotide exchange factor GrpE [Nanoarchaeota archaeon]MCG2720173.1 nucleotide exchange factor GrpE [Nanoarchaeota archaeon]
MTKEKRKEFEQKKEEIEKQTDTDNIQEYINQTQRIQAEFENYKKRTEKEKELHTNYAKAGLIKELLPILDNFNEALKSIENHKDKDTFEGVKLIYNEFLKLMEKEGLQEIQVLNCKLDPFKHEVIQQRESEQEESIILEEIQKGYMFKDKVLRTSKVIISKDIGGK